jgi:6-phosphogluconolactonase (cycloisomerase 2 family)
MLIDRGSAPSALTILLTLGLLAACGGGGGGGSGGPGQYTVGGSVSGFAGSGLVLQNAGSAPLTVTANGNFAFSGPVASGSAYAVTVGTQPTSPSQTCTVANGSGTITSANVTSVAVTCVTNNYSVGGSVSGLVGSGLILQNAGSAPLTVTGDGNFAFSGSIASGSAYAVTVGTQPTSPGQICTVANGSGTVTSANVTSVAVTCVTNNYSVGGTVSGLVGSGLALINGGVTLGVSANGTFAFSGKVASGSAYSITVTSQPTGPTEMCHVVNGSGTVGSTDVKSVAVKCMVSTARFAYVSSHSGVFCYSIDSASHALIPLGTPLCASGVLSGFGTEPRGKFGYATSAANQLLAYSIDQTSGALTQMAGAEVAAGSNPLDVHVDSSGRFAYVANYGSDNVSAYSIDPTTGHLTTAPGSPFTGGHLPNRLTIDVTGQFVYVANNGLISGAAKGVSGFAIDSSTGALTPISGSPYDTPNWAMDVAVDPATRFVFATIPSINQVSVFSISPTTGGLTAVPGSPFSTGAFPVGVVVDSTGSFLYVANSSANTISGYAIDSTTGALQQLAGSPFPCPGGPYYLNVSPNPGFLVVSNNSNGTVGTYSIDSQTGRLTQVSGSPVSAGGGSAYTISFAP